MIIIIEGPEKAGKSTFIARLKEHLESAGLTVMIRKWGKPEIDDREYVEPLAEDVANQNPKEIIIWDRGWVSEYVYSSFYGRPSSLRHNSMRAEEIYTSQVDINGGLKFIMLPGDIDELKIRRNSTDLDIPVDIEYEMFLGYAITYYWPLLINQYTEASMLENMAKVIFTVIGRMLALQKRMALNDQ
jgi:hypothetical protein